jgi:hypothetical protein
LPTDPYETQNADILDREGSISNNKKQGSTQTINHLSDSTKILDFVVKNLM